MCVQIFSRLFIMQIWVVCASVPRTASVLCVMVSTRRWKHFLKALIHVDMIASCSCFRLSVAHSCSQGCSHHFRSEGDKLFRGPLSDSVSSRIQLHLSLVAKEPHKHKQHSTRGLTSGPYNYILSKYEVKI